MTALLHKAIAAAENLPESDQDRLAQTLFDEMESEQRWDEVFVRHEDKMDKLEALILADIESGRTRPMEELWETERSSE